MIAQRPWACEHSCGNSSLRSQEGYGSGRHASERLTSSPDTKSETHGRFCDFSGTYSIFTSRRNRIVKLAEAFCWHFKGQNRIGFPTSNEKAKNDAADASSDTGNLKKRPRTTGLLAETQLWSKYAGFSDARVPIAPIASRIQRLSHPALKRLPHPALKGPARPGTPAACFRVAPLPTKPRRGWAARAA